MIAEISSSGFNAFFAWAPLVIGLVIYAAFYAAKRHEGATVPRSSGQTFACANCGRRGTREQMVPEYHDGATGWHCPTCAASQTVTSGSI